MVDARSQGCKSKAHIPLVDHVLKNLHASHCCYKKSGESERSQEREGDSVHDMFEE